jgi:hypothetical protein
MKNFFRTGMNTLMKAIKNLTGNAAGLMGFLCLILSLLPRESLPQESIRMAILPFDYQYGDSKYQELETRLPTRLRDALNRYNAINFNSTLISDSLLKGIAHTTKQDGMLKGEVSTGILRELVKADSLNDYFLQAALWEEDQVITLHAAILSGKSLKVLFEFEVDAPAEDFFSDKQYKTGEAFIKEMIEKIEIGIAKNIRIAILRFKMLGGDTTRFGVLEKAFPTMLATGLSVSSRLKLLETTNQDSLLDLILKSKRASGIYDYRTATKLGSRLHANYLIMGEFWEFDKVIRLDVRCVSIKFGEIVAIRGLNIGKVDINSIDQRISKLAAHLRAAIEKDYVKRGKRPESIAVSGVPPTPNTKKNRKILLELIKTANRKLKSVSGLRVIENSQKIEHFLKNRTDSWAMSSELGADLLLSFELDAANPDGIILGVELFDTQNPEEIAYNDSKLVFMATLDEALNEIILTVGQKRGIKKDDIDRDKLNSFKFRGLYQPIGFRFGTGLSIRNSPDLYLDHTGLGGVLIELGFTWTPFSSSKWQVEPLNIRLDFWASRSSQTIIGGDIIFAAVKYKFNPFHTRYPYLKMSLLNLGVFRIGPDDFGYDARIGLGIGMGIEQFIGDYWRLVFGIEYTISFDEIPAQTLSDIGFKGGRPGGFYMTVGLGYK